MTEREPRIQRSSPEATLSGQKLTATPLADRLASETLARSMINAPAEQALAALKRGTGQELGLRSSQVSQDEEIIHHRDRDGTERDIRFHDYGEVFSREGVYEAVLRMVDEQTVTRMADTIARVLDSLEPTDPIQEGIRYLDLGAGNGRMSEAVLRRVQAHPANMNIDRVVGLDLSPDAAEAAERDRPGLYDQYEVADFLAEDAAPLRDQLRSTRFNLLTVGSAVGFGDIPFEALWGSFALIENGGIAAFNANTKYKGHVGAAVARLQESGAAEVIEHLESYRHRNSFSGEPIFYSATVLRKTGDVPSDFSFLH